MKKFILLVCCLGLAFNQLSAQKWVSTKAEKRNVILEEFTGIHCGYCPDGHKIANDLVTANPGRVFLVNVHSGGYAVPANASEIDLRTTEGTAIDAAAKPSGYPAGSVNRAANPWAAGRDKWTASAATILKQTSAVNVAAKSTIDFSTRELITEVEIYYTSKSAASSNYLTVLLTQDNILGYQSDYGNYNPTNWTSDKQYRHNHVLRRAITSGGAFGEKIDTTTAGHYEYRKYTTKLPEKMNNTNVTLYNLQVVAFVTESQGNILSGVGTPVAFDPNLRADLGLEDLTVYPTNYCFSSLHPKIEVTNNSASTVKSFDVSIFLNGVENKKSFSGDLLKDGKTTIDWGEIPFAAKGAYTIAIQGFTNINGNAIYDMDFTNDASSSAGIGFTSKAFETFTGGFDGTLPANTALDQTQNPNFSIINTAGTVYGANGTSGAVRFALHSSWGMSGLPGHILLGEADLTKSTAPYLTYYYAYSDDNFGGTKPTVKVSVSEDCGSTWQDVNTTICTETGKPSTSGNWYIPATTDYKMVEISVEKYIGKTVLFRVTGTPGTAGNALYIDEISVGPKGGTSVKKPSIADIQSIEFNKVDMGKTKTMPVEIANTGDADLVVTKIEIAGDKVFTLQGVSFPFTVKPGEKVIVNVIFAPTGIKSYTAFLQITSNNNNNSNDVVSVDLNGDGRTLGVFTPADDAKAIVAMKVGPNPSADKSVLSFTLGGNASQFLEIYIINTLGQRVAEIGSQLRAPGSYSESIDVAALSSGNYRIIAQTAVERVQLPLVVNR